LFFDIYLFKYKLITKHLRTESATKTNEEIMYETRSEPFEILTRKPDDSYL